MPSPGPEYRNYAYGILAVLVQAEYFSTFSTNSRQGTNQLGGSFFYLSSMAVAVGLVGCDTESSPGPVDSSPTLPDTAVGPDAAAPEDAMGPSADAATPDAWPIVDASPEHIDASVVPGDSPFIARLSSSDGAFLDQFGLAIALADDGRLLAVGAPNRDHAARNDGAVYLFDRDRDQWTLVDTLTAAPVDYCNFGAAVALANGRLVIGAPGCNTVHVYEQVDADDWAETAVLTPVVPGPRSYSFGHSVAADGEAIAVGTFPQPDDAVPGAVHVFERRGDRWIPAAELSGSNATADDRFGHRVLLREDRLFVSAYSYKLKGAVYEFRRSGAGAWQEVEMLVAPDANEAHEPTFGASLALRGDTLVVGAIHADGVSPVSGAAYVFRERQGAWTPSAKLVDPNGAYRHLFGISVEIVDSRVFVGAIYASADEWAPTGAVFVFSEDQDGTWNYRDKLIPDDMASGSQFGMRLSASGGLLVIGSVREPFDVIEAGVVHIADVSRVVASAARP